MSISRVSYDDLAQMPEDGRRYELYDGEVFVVPSPILLHQIVAMRLWRTFSGNEEMRSTALPGLTLVPVSVFPGDLR